ncbi:type I restriction endonuclease subunit R [Streptantibioticus ferralitis]|uniref:type I site-specific deoxyribonuclease n=1 Tax=Streptantibioticus ferralitis TaxID=236510 RepID=A0ABT5Z1W2_9ACTN|nr:type I restriction endonuclease [Streptantibioticus ferralitis]MDF2257642.1 type I restriction endonuclease [Streptantibioticus ferralitis]
MGQPEYEKVERPLIDQLVAMGWRHHVGAPPAEPATDSAKQHGDDPAHAGQTAVAAVFADRFRTAVARINPGADGNPWLTGDQLEYLLALLLGTVAGRGPADRGVAENLRVTKLLRDGVNARTLPGWAKGDPEHVRLVDWEVADGPFAELGEAGTGNDLLAVSQFKAERSSGGTAIPDLVLFVNGLPWVVIECKAPLSRGGEKRFAIDWAVEDVIGYTGAEADDPVPELVRFAQLLVATDRDHAELGTVSSEAEHFAPWRTVYPAARDKVRGEAGVPEHRQELYAQETLVGGVLRPAHLLTLVRDFTTAAGRGPRTVKVVGRYQQFRAVHKIAKRLRDRRETQAAGQDVDQRGGVTWHTQGSGKSLTMAFLVRHLRSSRDLKGHKVVVVTDRKDLERQIRTSMAAADETIHRAPSVRHARRFLGLDVPDVVLVMLQKARRDDAADDGRDELLATSPDHRDHVHNRVANASSDIVVLVDEAHRGQSAWQHARLRAMLPNSAMVGFTGTPILSGARKTTEDIFGSYADTYTLKDAERDGSVVPVRYEAHQADLEIIEKAHLDAGFDEKVPSDPEKRTRVLRKFGRKKEVLESPSVIAWKADHMVRHWAQTALPDGFGAQVVAVSRRAAVAYRDALRKALAGLVAELDALGGDAHDPAAGPAPDGQVDLVSLLRYRDVLASVDAAVVISKSQKKGESKGAKTNDPKEWDAWTRPGSQMAHIERFRRGVPVPDPFEVSEDPSWAARIHGRPQGGPQPGTEVSVHDPWHRETAAQRHKAADRPDAKKNERPLGFLVVTNMLLTGFDAPVEQVMYLDRPMFGAGLLQAIARTNRPYHKKQWGQVVDYVGIGPDLAKSMNAYEDAHLRAVLGYEDVSFDHLDPESGAPRPVRDRMWLQTDAAADALLADLYKRLGDFLAEQGISTLTEESQREDLLAALEDPLLRGEFDELARDFLNALNAVLPRPGALVYETFAALLGEVQYLARVRYLDGRDQFSPRRYGAKVRALIAAHLRVIDIVERVPGIELGAPDFMDRVNANADARARISYLTSRIHTHITTRLDGDRDRYGTFSERLEAVIQRMNADFDAAAAALARLAADIVAAERDGGPEAEAGLEPWTERPVYAVLAGRVTGAGPVVPAGVDLHQAARDLTWTISGLVRSPNFTTLPDARERVRRELRNHLEAELFIDWGETGPIASVLVDLAFHRHSDFLHYAERGEP